MKILLLLFIAILTVGCGKGMRPYGFDSLDSKGGEQSGFAGVTSILKRSCVSCHSSFGTYTEQDFVTYGYVVPGSLSASPLYSRLKGAGVGGVEAMPQGGQLTMAQLAVISNWIVSFGQAPAPTGPTAAERLAAAMGVLRQNCFSCHSTAQTAASQDYNGTRVPAFANFTRDNEFVTSGLVNPGQPETSWMYRALKTYGDIGRMPANAAALPTDSQTKLREWMLKIGQP